MRHSFSFHVLSSSAIGILMALFAAPASAATTLKSIDAVLALGYEIKAINMLPASDAKDVFAFGAATPVAETIITLQKGNSIAVCSSATVSWNQLLEGPMTFANACYVR